MEQIGKPVAQGPDLTIDRMREAEAADSVDWTDGTLFRNGQGSENIKVRPGISMQYK
jgi:hypothetical protein